MSRINHLSYIDSKVSLGKYCSVHPFAVIGAPAEHRRLTSEGSVSIGDRCEIRSHVTIDSGLTKDTHVGNNVLIMTKSHVGHCAIIEDDVTISSCSVIGGHSILQKGANLGLNSTVLPKLVVGAYSIVGAGSVVTKHVYPFSKAYGNPAKEKEFNIVALQRAGWSHDETYDAMCAFNMRSAYNAYRPSTKRVDEILNSFKDVLVRVENDKS